MHVLHAWARWPRYLMEAAELGMFMISACFLTVLLFHPASPVLQWITSAPLRRMLMGTAMGLTAVGIIKCPWGRTSGAHFNPSITITFLRLGKIGGRDAACYIVFQFIGGILGVGLSALVLGRLLSNPAVDYVVTVPGAAGTQAAFAAELFMAALLMGVVLITADRVRLAPYTPYFVGVLIALYVLFLGPISGFSINPARTVASAVFADVWRAAWVYFTAPVLGMLLSAELYVKLAGTADQHAAHPRGRTRRRYFTHRHLAGEQADD